MGVTVIQWQSIILYFRWGRWEEEEESVGRRRDWSADGGEGALGEVKWGGYTLPAIK